MNSDYVAIVQCIMAAITVFVAVWTIRNANEKFKKTMDDQNEKFKKTMTVKVELHVLSTLNGMLTEGMGASGSKEILITTVDYWCKLITNDYLDETLSADSDGTIETLIKEYKDDINKGNRKYIIEYAKRKGISLQAQ